MCIVITYPLLILHVYSDNISLADTLIVKCVRSHVHIVSIVVLQFTDAKSDLGPCFTGWWRVYHQQDFDP